MAKFCRSCGAALEEGAETCAACGASTKPVEAAAPQQKSEALNKVSNVIGNIFGGIEKFLGIIADKVSKLDTKKIGESFESVRRIVLIVMAVLCLITAILNLFGTYDVTMTGSVSYSDEKQTIEESGPISELYEADEFVDLMIVNILYGVTNLGLIALAVLLFLQMTNKKPTKKLYSMYVLAGLCANIVYAILFEICGSGSQSMYGVTMKYSLELHFITWINIVLYALLFAMDLAKKTPKAPAVEAAQPTEPTSAE